MGKLVIFALALFVASETGVLGQFDQLSQVDEQNVGQLELLGALSQHFRPQGGRSRNRPNNQLDQQFQGLGIGRRRPGRRRPTQTQTQLGQQQPGQRRPGQRRPGAGRRRPQAGQAGQSRPGQMQPGRGRRRPGQGQRRPQAGQAGQGRPGQRQPGRGQRRRPNQGQLQFGQSNGQFLAGLNNIQAARG